MASIFRRSITKQIYPILKPFLEEKEKILINKCIPLTLKFSQLKVLDPQFEMSWRDIINLKPELENKIHVNSIMTYLKNQDFPTTDGIKEISFHSVHKDKFVFTINQEIFTSLVLKNLCQKIKDFPEHSTYFKSVPVENIIIDFSSPNIAKPFHYGHFRSTIVGNFIANICEYVGHDVTRINYLGDWGMQYGILACGFEIFGSEDLLQQNPLNHLYEVYKRANEEFSNNPDFEKKSKEYFVKLENGDPDAVELWNKLKKISLNELDETYKRLNVRFDETHGESMYSGKIKEILDALITKDVASIQEDGSIEATVNLGNDQIGKTILKKSDGTSLYLTRDIAAAIDRRNRYHFDQSFYVVDSSQVKHFKHLKAILESMGFSWQKNMQHINFGRISNFSTRKGNVAFLSDILNEAKERILENMKSTPTTKVNENNMEEVADILGVASLIINDLQVRRKKNYKFDWEKALNMKADTGITLQYCHARLNNIKENCGVDLNLNCELASLVEPEAISLIAQLARFDEVIYMSYKELEPCILVHYLFNLRSEIGRAIKVLPVKGSNPYVARARLLLFHASYLVLHKSFEILGITPLDKM